MAIKTFKRFELKFLPDEEQYRAVKAALRPYVEADPYCIDGKTYDLFNIYYDTDDYRLIRHSLSKPPFKQKLRLRSYCEDPAPEDNVFIELKKKADGCVNKRRVTMRYKDALSFLETGKYEKTGDYLHDTVAHEIAYFLSVNRVSPKAVIAYRREAFFLKTDKNIRITFDSDIRGGSVGTGREECLPLLADGRYVLEIKINDHIPLPVVKALSDNNVYKHSFSKYGQYYMQQVCTKKGIHHERVC